MRRADSYRMPDITCSDGVFSVRLANALASYYVHSPGWGPAMDPVPDRLEVIRELFRGMMDFEQSIRRREKRKAF